MTDLFGFSPRAPRRPQGQGMGGHHSTEPGTTTWLTPPHIIEALGGPESFDLDPCGFPGWKTAKEVSCWPIDGLRIAWRGRVWLNPPYTTGQLERWLRRLAEHGRGTALIFARTETEAFQRWVFEQASGVLFLAGRLTFHLPGGELAKGNAGAPSVLCAYGQDDLDRLAASDLAGALTPLRFARFVLVGAMDAAPPSWREVIADLMADGPVTVSDLYRSLARHPKAAANRHLRAKIRQTLQRGEFRRAGDGLWERAA